MKFKKFFALAIAVIMFCTSIVSVSAARRTHISFDIEDLLTEDVAATAYYELGYYSGMNCVRAINRITYGEDMDVSQCNFPGLIALNVTMNESSWNARKVEYLFTTTYHDEFSLEYYIPAGYVLVEAVAAYSTNEMDVVYNEKTYYANLNYDYVKTSTDLVVTP